MINSKSVARITSVTIYVVNFVMNVIVVHVFVENYKNVANVYARMR